MRALKTEEIGVPAPASPNYKMMYYEGMPFIVVDDEEKGLHAVDPETGAMIKPVGRSGFQTKPEEMDWRPAPVWQGRLSKDRRSGGGRYGKVTITSSGEHHVSVTGLQFGVPEEQIKFIPLPNGASLLDRNGRTILVPPRIAEKR